MGKESPPVEGERPVREIRLAIWNVFPSRAGHEKSGLNPGRPLPKTKYSSVTDSELVP